MLNSPTQLNNPQDEEDTINGKLKKDTRAVNALHEKSITRDELHRKKATRDAEELSSEWPDSSRTMDDSTLAVFTRPGCPYSEEALREAELAQIMVRNLGGALKVVNVDTKQERDLAKLLGIKTVPCLRYYRDANLRSASHSTYEGINVSADEIAHWVLLHQGKTVQSASVRQSAFRMAPFRGSAVGPVVRASVHEGSPRAALVLRLSKNTEELPSRFTLFNIEYIDPSEREEFRVYRKQLPFDVGEEEFLTLEDTQWEPKSILALMLEAENRKVFYGDKPPPVLLGERALLSVYVSRFENLQDIAWLLMEFHEAYRDRIAFHIARSTLKEAARSQDTFSHTWGGAVLTDQRPNTSAYQKVAGVVRELSPFSQYSLSMPFNYHSMLSFLEEWSAGKPELHFRSNRLTYSEKESQVMELNHLQFLNVLQRANRVHFGVLYYEPECSDCQIYLEAWKAAAEAFNTAEALKGRLLFGQVNAHVNDIIDFDMKEKIPSIAVYPEGLQALDKRILYTGPPLVNSLLDFLGRLAAKQEEL
ncbi:protein disulfide isomerase, putative [Eimeria praecox]|uniref:Protein disulfide isomerase, putative n=1 Tax=Eimeria praecox TaxID=51316 RepID=U6GWZ9_9EIME|nr:protein disulfide isomerase, putative [Eimeria praecox]